MPLITYVSHDGASYEVDVPSGTSVMQGAVDNMIDGIVGECGGSCSCATCHVIVDKNWYLKLTPAAQLEKDMLEFAAEPAETGRLSCQIPVTDALNGLVVRVPAAQY